MLGHFLNEEKMAMEQILCVYCGDLFDASPRHKNQIACKKAECQKAKKADWQRHKMKIDPINNANQKISQKEWVRANPGYWKNTAGTIPKKRNGIESFKPSETERPGLPIWMQRWIRC